MPAPTGKASRAPRVLLVNDDGPPSSTSPHVLPLYEALRALGWDVTVVLPSGQRSWGSMAFSIRGNLPVWYYYPLGGNYSGAADGTELSWSAERRPVQPERGEIAEWALIDGSPTTATNVGLFNSDLLFGADSHPVQHNVQSTPIAAAASSSSSLSSSSLSSSAAAVAAAPETAFSSSSSSSPPQAPPFSSWADLVISGPNFGRNTGTSFALSSGTLGAALSGAVSGVKSIAISYGHFAGNTGPQRPSFPPGSGRSDPASTTEPVPAVQTDASAGHIVRSPPAPEHVEQLATGLTVRIVRRLWEEWEEGVQCYSVNVPLSWTLEEPRIYWTRMWENHYPRLFKQVSLEEVAADPRSQQSSLPAERSSKRPQPKLHFTFAPPMGCMLAPTDLPEGTDIWALMNGWVSVVRLRANYTHIDAPQGAPVQHQEQAWSVAATGETVARAGPGTRWML